MNHFLLLSLLTLASVVMSLEVRGGLLLATDTPGDLGDAWQNRIRPATANQLRDVAFGGDRWVAVGANGAAFFSLDALDWTPACYSDREDLNGVAWTGGIFVAVGRAGEIARSVDGVVWESVDSGVSATLNDVTVHNGTFVATGSQGVVLRSADGTMWTGATSPPPGTFSGACVASNGSRLVTGGTGSYYSDNGGDTWTAGAGGFSSSMVDMGWNGTEWYAVGSSSGAFLVQSSDGSTWSEIRVSFTGTPTAIVQDGATLYLAVSGATTSTSEFGWEGEILFSADSGSTWSAMAQPFRYAPIQLERLNGLLVGVGQRGVVLVSQDGMTWNNCLLSGPSSWQSTLGGANVDQNTRTIPRSALTVSTLKERYPNAPNETWSAIHGAAWNGEKFAAVGADSVFLSSDGYSWQDATPAASLFRPVDICWSNGEWWLLADFGRLYRSANGVDWTQYSQPISFPNAIAASETRVIAVGSRGEVIDSTDGINWNLQDLGIRDLVRCVHARGKFIAVGDTGFSATSDDGVSWTVAPQNGNDDFHAVCSFRGEFVATGGAHDNVYRFNETGGIWEWAGTRLDFLFDTANLLTLNGELIADGSDGNWATSRDGVNWTFATIESSAVHTAAAWNGTYFIVFANEGRSLLSRDGVSWAKTGGIPNGGGPSDVVAFGQGFLAVNGRKVLLSEDSISWEEVHDIGGEGPFPYLTSVAGSDPGGPWVAVGSGGVILRSIDGQTWNPVSSGVGENLDTVVWAGDRFVAGGGAGRLLYSIDGLSWTPANPGRVGSIEHLVWTGTRLVGIIDDRWAASTSDYLAWEEEDLGTNTIVDSITFANGEIVGLGRIGAEAQLFASVDGVSWTNEPLGFYGRLDVALLYDGGQLLAVGPELVISSGDARDGFRKWQSRCAPGEAMVDFSDPINGSSMSAGIAYSLGFECAGTFDEVGLMIQPGGVVSFTVPLFPPSDVTIAVEVSADLTPESWSTLGEWNSDIGWDINATFLASEINGGYERFQIQDTAIGGERGFVRVRASQTGN